MKDIDLYELSDDELEYVNNEWVRSDWYNRVCKEAENIQPNSTSQTIYDVMSSISSVVFLILLVLSIINSVNGDVEEFGFGYIIMFFSLVSCIAFSACSNNIRKQTINNYIESEKIKWFNKNQKRLINETFNESNINIETNDEKHVNNDGISKEIIALTKAYKNNELSEETYSQLLETMLKDKLSVSLNSSEDSFNDEVVDDVDDFSNDEDYDEHDDNLDDEKEEIDIYNENNSEFENNESFDNDDSTDDSGKRLLIILGVTLLVIGVILLLSLIW